jgi:hypothetical protein
LLPYPNADVKHYQAGFQSGKSTTDLLFALRQILEKGNGYGIKTHHLFIDFKAAYDSITRNEVYRQYVRAQLSYENNTSYGSNTEHCAVLRENSERLF